MRWRNDWMAHFKAAKMGHLIISSSHNICGAVYVVWPIYAPLVIDLIFTSRPPWVSCFCCFGFEHWFPTCAVAGTRVRNMYVPWMAKDISWENLLLAIENSLRKELPHRIFHLIALITKGLGTSLWRYVGRLPPPHSIIGTLHTTGPTSYCLLPLLILLTSSIGFKL